MRHLSKLCKERPYLLAQHSNMNCGIDTGEQRKGESLLFRGQNSDRYVQLLVCHAGRPRAQSKRQLEE